MDNTIPNEPIELSTKIIWSRTGNSEFPYANEENADAEYLVRVNDFPDEPLYTLIKNQKAICSFNNWPSLWEKSA